MLNHNLNVAVRSLTPVSPPSSDFEIDENANMTDRYVLGVR
jgi:hypothetical protein